MFLTLLKERASKAEQALINAGENQQKKAARKRKREAPVKPTAAGEDGISASRIRAADDDDNDDDDEEERTGRQDIEVVEARQAEVELPDRITVEIMRQKRGKRIKRTAIAHGGSGNNGASDDVGAIAEPQANDNPFGAVW